MADDVDRLNERDETFLIAKLKDVSRLANIPEGEPGTCEICGKFSKRLVDGYCAPCRDEWDLP